MLKYVVKGLTINTVYLRASMFNGSSVTSKLTMINIVTAIQQVMDSEIKKTRHSLYRIGCVRIKIRSKSKNVRLNEAPVLSDAFAQSALKIIGTKHNMSFINVCGLTAPLFYRPNCHIAHIVKTAQ
jgi:hypothetical protein